RQQVRDAIGGFATPDVVHLAPGLPKTRSGKIMRRILRQIAAGEDEGVGGVATLAEPRRGAALVGPHKERACAHARRARARAATARGARGSFHPRAGPARPTNINRAIFIESDCSFAGGSPRLLRVLFRVPPTATPCRVDPLCVVRWALRASFETV